MFLRNGYTYLVRMAMQQHSNVSSQVFLSAIPGTPYLVYDMTGKTAAILVPDSDAALAGGRAGEDVFSAGQTAMRAAITFRVSPLI